MKNIFDVLGFIIRALIAGLAVAFLVVYLWPSVTGRNGQGIDPPAETAISTQPAHGPETISYADAVDRAAPSVVSIYTSSLDPQPVTPETQQLLGPRYLYRMRRDMGSGVLVSSDGYVLTNHHVINSAQNIKVALWDGRIAGAQVVGSDPETDLAVLKINLTGLPAAPISPGPPPRVGDVVLAIGNALGLSHTVTMGIISGTGRENIASRSYEGFLQTDAAINAGNSGGALINTHGELIGINTRNLGGPSGAQNIGFAIPISTAQNVKTQIIEYGSVRRGWLGALFSDLPPTRNAGVTAARNGVWVRDVTREGPAWRAGIREGDVIVSLNKAQVNDSQAVNLLISLLQPGEQVDLEVRRGGETFQTYATLIQQPPTS